MRQGAAHCENGDFLDRMLIEELLRSLIDRDMCNEIISKKPKTFKTSYEIAHALESTRHIADEVKSTMQLTPAAESTHALNSTIQER